MRLKQPVKIASAISSCVVGAAAACAVFIRLQQCGPLSSPSGFTIYALCIVDGVVSLTAGVLLGYIFQFLLWDCILKAALQFIGRRR